MSESAQSRKEVLEAFQNGMRHVAATVYAVTTRHDGMAAGILATAVNSLSFDPPSLLVCINRNASLHDPLLAEKVFAVNVLGLSNRDVADHFMNPEAPDRFSTGNWQDIAGVPVLTDAQSSFVCRLVHHHEFGTHSVFIGELIAAHHRENATPLTYFDRNYIDISAAPERSGQD